MVQTRSMNQKKRAKKSSQVKNTSKEETLIQQPLRPQRKAAQKATRKLTKNRSLYFELGRTPPLTKTGEKADSSSLARARWYKKSDKKRDKTTFEDWKKGREAHHLIPSEAFRVYEFPKGFINSPENGMMLPSGRTATHDLRNSSLDKTKVAHVRKTNHSEYNKNMMKYLHDKYGGNTKISLEDANYMAKTLRSAHRNRVVEVGVEVYKYVDDINPYELFRTLKK